MPSVYCDTNLTPRSRHLSLSPQSSRPPPPRSPRRYVLSLSWHVFQRAADNQTPTATNTQFNNVFVPNSFYAAAARRGLIESRDIAMHEVSTILELPAIIGNNNSEARGLRARGPAFKCPPGLAVISACANTVSIDNYRWSRADLLDHP